MKDSFLIVYHSETTPLIITDFQPVGGPDLASSRGVHLDAPDGGGGWGGGRVIPLTSSLCPTTLQPAPQGRCQLHRPGQGSLGVGSLGPSPAIPSSGPPSCLHFNCKNAKNSSHFNYWALHTPATSSYKGTTDKKMIFQHAFSLSLLFL